MIETNTQAQTALNTFLSSYSAFVAYDFEYYGNQLDILSETMTPDEAFRDLSVRLVQHLYTVEKNVPNEDVIGMSPEEYINSLDTVELLSTIYPNETISQEVVDAYNNNEIDISDLVVTSSTSSTPTSPPSLSDVVDGNTGGNDEIVLDFDQIPDAGVVFEGLNDEQVDFLNAVYLGSFFRAPDHDGLEYWATVNSDFINQGMSVEQASLETSKHMYIAGIENNENGVDLSNAEFVEENYNNLLGRSSDVDGLNYWVEQLDVDNINRTEFLHAFITAAKSNGETEQLDRLIKTSEYFAQEHVSGSNGNSNIDFLNSVIDVQDDVLAADLMLSVINEYGYAEDTNLVGVDAGVNDIFA